MSLMNDSSFFDLDSRHLPIHPSSDRLPVQTPGGLPADLFQALRQCGPIPPAAAFLGLALDGLPVLLNLRDPSPGSLLIVGDLGSGKRRLLQVVARAADFLEPAGDVRFAVLTDHLREWEALAQSHNCEGVLPFRHPLTTYYIRSLMDAASPTPASYLLLLVDGLEGLVADPDLKDDMLSLLRDDPTRSIWPIVAVTTPRTPELASWLQPFRTVLCGRSNERPSMLTNSSSLPVLNAGTQFALLSGNDWLPFWVPEPI